MAVRRDGRVLGWMLLAVCAVFVSPWTAHAARGTATMYMAKVITPSTYAQTCAAEAQVCSWTRPGSVPRSLMRPLRDIRLGRDGRCPVSGGAPYRTPAFAGVVQGKGPVRPLIASGSGKEQEAGVIGFDERAPGGWYGAKTLWFAAASYLGPVLLRGREVDGRGALAFGEAPAELAWEIPPGIQAAVNAEGSMREWPGSTWIRSPGCYAWQIDGTSFSETIVIRATPATARRSRGRKR